MWLPYEYDRAKCTLTNQNRIKSKQFWFLFIVLNFTVTSLKMCLALMIYDV